MKRHGAEGSNGYQLAEVRKKVRVRWTYVQVTGAEW